MSFNMKLIFLLITFCLSNTLSSNRWPNHDISTLKLLQIVHRHGDRTPTGLPPNDPFKNESYWPEGIGQLTTKGKYRLYKTGQLIREEYHEYLGDNYSPREVYARSGLSDRCIESLSCLLSGAYPPKNKIFQWNNGSDAELGDIWQPIPIEAWMPRTTDNVLEQFQNCSPILNRERAKIYNRTDLRKYVEDNKEFFANLTKITGSPIVDILSAASLLGLQLEMERGYYWSDVWTKEEEQNIYNKLWKEANHLRYRYNWDSPIILRLTAGGLVKELIKNFNAVLHNQNKKKLYVYATHDTMIAPLMHALNIYNDEPPPFGSALFVELHEKKDSTKSSDYFVRAFYHNETVIGSGTPHPILWGNCGNSYDCPIDQFFNSTKHLIYENIEKECNE